MLDFEKIRSIQSLPHLSFEDSKLAIFTRLHKYEDTLPLALAELDRLRSELAAAQAGPVVEWRHLPGSAGWERADVGQFSLLLMGDSAWRLICGDQAVIARGSPGGDAGKAAAVAAYRRACGFPTIPPCAG
jgi:hypothetical protein